MYSISSSGVPADSDSFLPVVGSVVRLAKSRTSSAILPNDVCPFVTDVFSVRIASFCFFSAAASSSLSMRVSATIAFSKASASAGFATSAAAAGATAPLSRSTTFWACAALGSTKRVSSAAFMDFSSLPSLPANFALIVGFSAIALIRASLFFRATSSEMSTLLPLRANSSEDSVSFAKSTASRSPAF